MTDCTAEDLFIGVVDYMSDIVDDINRGRKLEYEQKMKWKSLVEMLKQAGLFSDTDVFEAPICS